MLCVFTAYAYSALGVKLGADQLDMNEKILTWHKNFKIVLVIILKQIAHLTVDSVLLLPHSNHL